MSFVQVHGVQTWYEKVGSGPTLVLLHGWANSWEAWLPLIPLLSDQWTLIMPDLPGCGKSASPSHGWTTRQHADWFTTFLGHIHGDAPIGYIGHSFGGKILLDYCSKLRGSKEKLVLINASGIPNTLSFQARALSSLARLTPNYFKKTISSTLRKKIYSIAGVETDDASASAFQHQTLRLILSEDYTKQAEDIQNTTRIIWGSADTSTPLWQAKRLQKAIVHSSLVVFDAGHFPHHVHPEEVGKNIVQFLHQ